MRVATRLYFAVAPAVLGVLVVAALGYWGERGRQAPSIVVGIAVIASVTSLVIAWRNTRYVAQRIALLAQPRSGPTTPPLPDTLGIDASDELDHIAATVTHLDTAVANERRAGDARAAVAQSRVAEYTDLLDGAVRSMRSSLEQARLPLHILLASPFGELNENQEEMLDATQHAIDAADADLTRLRKLIEIDTGVVSLSRQPLAVGELLRAPVAIAKARASRSTIGIVADVSDALPRVVVDPLYTQEAVTSLLLDAVAAAAEGSEVRVRALERTATCVAVTIEPAPCTGNEPLDVRLAKRLITHEGGTVADEDHVLHIELPADAPVAARGGVLPSQTGPAMDEP